MRNKMRSILSLLLVLFTLLTAVQALAKDGRTSRANEREFTGTVELVTTRTITVDGHVINIVWAEMNDPIVVGSIVKVHYTVGVSGAWVAREVELASADDGDDDSGDDHSGEGSGSDDHGGESGPD
jgi:hypothetical protein